MVKIIVTSKNALKIECVKQLLAVTNSKWEIIGHECSDNDTINQPLNNALNCAHHRVKILLGSKTSIEVGDIILAIENSLEGTSENGFSDVCYLAVFNAVAGKHDDGTEIKNPPLELEHPTFYKSFGVKLHDNLAKEFFNEHFQNGKNTYGSFLEKRFGVKGGNWMSDVRFGNVDRREQITNVLCQWFLDYSTKRYPDFPKQGILFKDISSLMDKNVLNKMLIDICAKQIDSALDVDDIDYIVGLDSRGYHLAAPLAQIFKKGYIPLRKISKTPEKDPSKIVRENYSTEYSDDSFGLIKNPDYIGKRCLIVDDLLATGGSIEAAYKVLRNAGMKVVGFITVYDVEPLRSIRRKVIDSLDCPVKIIIIRPNDHVTPYMFGPVTNITLNPQPDQFVGDWKMDIHADKAVVIACSGSKKLAEKISKQLGAVQCEAIITKFNNGETRVEIETNIRNMQAIIVCSTRTGHVNDDIMELMLILDACNRSEVDKVHAVIPGFPYARQDKKDKSRVPIAAAVISRMLNSMHVNTVISLDLHAPQLQGLIDKGFHNLSIKNYMARFLVNNYISELGKQNCVLVAPDVGSAKRVETYAKMLGMKHVILHKHRDYDQPGTVDKSILIGNPDDYIDKTGIIFDDIADTMGTMVSAINELVKAGIKDVIVAVTHGVFSDQALSRIKKCDKILAVIVTNSLPQNDNIQHCKKIIELDASELLARALDAIMSHGKSVSTLFK